MVDNVNFGYQPIQIGTDVSQPIATGVIKDVTSPNGTQTQIYQQPLPQGGVQGALLNEVQATATRLQ
jgi:hypothetical protein